MRGLVWLLFLLPATGYAEYAKVTKDNEAALIVEVEQSYLLGDGDSRIDARNIALQQAKVKAAELSGSYIESQRIIENDEIQSETIKTVNTALLKSTIKSESFSVTEKQQMKITLLLESELDKRSFLAKLGLLKQDAKKQEQMVALENHNKKLQLELDGLNRQLSQLRQQQNSSLVTDKPRKELLKRRDEIFGEIEQTENSIRKVFKKGTLFSLAKKSSSEYEDAMADITTNVWGYIQNNAHVTLGEPAFRDNGNGTYNIEVKVDWRIDRAPILKTLNKYFWGYERKALTEESTNKGFHNEVNNVIEVRSFYNEEDMKKKPYSDKLYHFYSSKPVVIRLSAASYSGELAVAGIDKEFFGCSGSCYKIQTRPGEKAQFGQNPVVIKNVPSSVLEELTAIDAKVVF